MNIDNLLSKAGLKPGAGVPGMGIQQQNFDLNRFMNNNGMKVKGTKFTSVIGTTEIDIKLSGTAKLMVGFKIVPKAGHTAAYNPAKVFSLVVNNDVIIQDAPADAFSITNISYSTQNYCEFLRLLNGSDNIKILFTDTAAVDYNIYFYYV